MMPIAIGDEALHTWSTLRTLILVVVALGFFTRGPRRWVRIGIAFLLFDWLLSTFVAKGPERGAFLLAATLASLVAAHYVGLSSWRAPRRIQYAPVTAEMGTPWPGHATVDIERWTRELVALGFDPVPDVWYSWHARGRNRVSRLRLFHHPDEPCWVSLYACADPKGVARAFHSRLVDCTWLETGDRVSDKAMIVDPAFITQRGSSGDSCGSLLERHRNGLARLAVAAVPTEDPIAEHSRARDAWISGLLDGRDARIDGDTVVLEPRAIFASMPRFVAGWFA